MSITNEDLKAGAYGVPGVRIEGRQLANGWGFEER